MKINELLKKRPTLSFEIFPPKNNENDITSIYATIDELAKMNPDFISVTYGANGSTSKNTCKIASTIKNKYGIESVAHLTCMNNTKDEIKEILEELKENGIENVLSLRGDYPKDGDGINHGDCTNICFNGDLAGVGFIAVLSSGGDRGFTISYRGDNAIGDGGNIIVG